MLGLFNRKGYIVLCKIFYLYYFCNRMVVILSRWNYYIITDLDAVIISNIVIAFIPLIKFHSAINVVLFAALYLFINGRIKNLTKAIKTDEFPDIVGKVTPCFW